MLQKLSDGLARLEIGLAAVLAAAVTLLILLNILTRAVGMAIYWVDELAIYAMIWSTFLATSVVLKQRDAITVTILIDKLGERGRYWMSLFADLMVLLFALILLVLCWRWMDPPTLIANGFNIKAFQAETFNFIYSEKTNTLGMLKIWPWLIVPLFSISLTVHSLNNLALKIFSIPIYRSARA
ncbi:TRAP-type C4-dicarboxylate transport system, small permease component [Marinobacterium lacunae]|uniref:TRAP transporter small permease protein n=1 Tax=Marinobacterium lacunae TaxID=1232683 RepID=A0A081G3G2_9GAMM|nr:TRAP transporter small permease subunit [Marinobacterium lacunae]KEA65317.1 TRAP-type C4-dicarboxylate transport system, small permease component [Marinobacterium lacunae]